MRVVALEEHYTVPRLVSRIDPAAIRRRGFPGPDVVWAQVIKRNELANLGDARLADMDASGITVQVLSVAGPGADVVPGAEGIALARDYNNALAEAGSRHPDRLRGFAHLPMHSPDAAADELERTIKDLGFHGLLVNGPTDGRFLDDPTFEPILARAEALDVPIYIHPGMPPAEVRKAYYEGFSKNINFGLATFAWGWHYEVAVHVMRLAVSGAMDKFPKLNFIIGHMGEGLPAMLARCEHQFGRDLSFLSRPLSKMIPAQVYVTSAGFFTNPPFVAALETFGIDRLMFSVDYPYASNADARAFLDNVPLSPSDREKIAHGNADRLLKLNA